jgi:hypothetical protein
MDAGPHGRSAIAGSIRDARHAGTSRFRELSR